MVQTIQHGGVLKYVEWNMPLSCKRLSYNTRLPGNVAIRSASKLFAMQNQRQKDGRMIVQTGLERRWKGPLATRTFKGALQLRSVGKYIISIIKEYKKGFPASIVLCACLYWHFYLASQWMPQTFVEWSHKMCLPRKPGEQNYVCTCNEPWTKIYMWSLWKKI